MFTLQHVNLATCALCNMCTLHIIRQDKSARWISWTNEINESTRQTSWTEQLDRPVLYTWSLGQFAYSKIDLSVCIFFSFQVRRRPCFRIEIITPPLIDDVAVFECWQSVKTWKLLRLVSHWFVRWSFILWLFTPLATTALLASTLGIICKNKSSDKIYLVQ